MSESCTTRSLSKPEREDEDARALQPPTQHEHAENEPPRTSPNGSSSGDASISPIAAALERTLKEEGVAAVLAALEDNHKPTYVDPQQALTAARQTLSTASYEEIMAFFGKDINPDEPFEGWKDMNVPRILLPLTAIDFKEHVYCAQGVRRYRPDPRTEVPTPAFLFGPPFQSLVVHFGGTLRIRLHSSSNGQAVEDVACGNSVLFFVRAFPPETEFLPALAQVCGELFAIFHFNQLQNKDAIVDEATPLPVRTCICDTNFIYFLSYDGKELKKYVFPRPTTTNSIEDYVSAALDASQYVFGILLQGYNHIVLRKASSIYRARHRDPSAAREPAGWETAAKLGWESAQYLNHAHEKRSEHAAETGLQKLYDSLTAWASANSLSILLPPEIEARTEKLLKEYLATTSSSANANPSPTPPPEETEPVVADVETPRQKAVNRFWEKLSVPSTIREHWETTSAVPGSFVDNFDILSDFARHMTDEEGIYHEMVHKVLPEHGTLFVQALKWSQEQNVWQL